MRLLRLAAVALSAVSASASTEDSQEGGYGEACQYTAVDYADAGSYLVNGNNDGKFTFATRFDGNCTNSEIKSVLRDPDNHVYSCTAMRPGDPGSIQISQCDIEYYEMQSGIWQIQLQLPTGTTITRTFTLTVGAPSTILTTITPTVIVRETRTPPASTVLATTFQTITTTLDASTLSTPCTAPKTTKTTVRGTPTLVTETQLIVQLTTDATTTAAATKTSFLTATCRYSGASSSTRKPSTTPTPSRTPTTSPVKATTPPPPKTSPGVITPAPAPALPSIAGGYSFTWSGSTCALLVKAPAQITAVWKGGPPPLMSTVTPGGPLPTWVTCVKLPAATKTRRQFNGARIAAFTSTVMETTYTETQVSTTFVPAETITKYVVGTAVQTITPPPTTLCLVPAEVTETVTLPGPGLTQITLVTSTSHVTATVYVT
ncbi:hypothetical protein QBC47DRAFT_438402 [Echria macrotheca]|uniref:Uncharacterized protein n=1 Tax=Echria macrotheca TaxID=438768 RepID=A0AAJ0BKS2_9PEZI|nr:hypothetical protein QBC47DRAFT_438402 [Echria macrotheca]